MPRLLGDGHCTDLQLPRIARDLLDLPAQGVQVSGVQGDLQGPAEAPQVFFRSNTTLNLAFQLDELGGEFISNVFRFAEKTAGELEALRQQLLIVSS